MVDEFMNVRDEMKSAEKLQGIRDSCNDAVGRRKLANLVMNHGLECVIFDLDGTLIHSGVSFTPYRTRLEIEGDVIAAINTLPEEKQREKWKIIDEYENELQENARPAPGAKLILYYLREHGIKVGVATRSTGVHARKLITQLGLDVDLFIGREDTQPKPHPDGIHYLLKELKVNPEDAIMVGDFLWDMLAGRNAGLLTVLVLQEHSVPYVDKADIVVCSLTELLKLIKNSMDNRLSRLESNM